MREEIQQPSIAVRKGTDAMRSRHEHYNFDWHKESVDSLKAELPVAQKICSPKSQWKSTLLWLFLLPLAVGTVGLMFQEVMIWEAFSAAAAFGEIVRTVSSGLGTPMEPAIDPCLETKQQAKAQQETGLLLRNSVQVTRMGIYSN